MALNGRQSGESSRLQYLGETRFSQNHHRRKKSNIKTDYLLPAMSSGSGSGSGSESASDEDNDATLGFRRRLPTNHAARKRPRAAGGSPVARESPGRSPGKSILEDVGYSQNSPDSSSSIGSDEDDDEAGGPRGATDGRANDSSSSSFSFGPDQQEDDDDDESYTETRRATISKKQRGAATDKKLAAPPRTPAPAAASLRKPSKAKSPPSAPRARSSHKSPRSSKKAPALKPARNVKSAAAKGSVDDAAYDSDVLEMGAEVAGAAPAGSQPPPLSGGKAASATKSVKASSPRKRSLKSPATAKAAAAAEIRELDIRLPPSNKLPLECGVLMHLTAAAVEVGPAAGAPPSTSSSKAGPTRGGGGGRTAKSLSVAAGRARADSSAKRSRNAAASSATVTTNTGSVLELDGATGAVGRLEVDAQGVVLDLKGTQFRGTLFPCATAMVLTVITKKGEDVPHLRLEGITDEFCRLVPTGHSALDQMDATTVHGLDQHLNETVGSLMADDVYYDELRGIGSTDPPKAPPVRQSASKSRKR